MLSVLSSQEEEYSPPPQQKRRPLVEAAGDEEDKQLNMVGWFQLIPTIKCNGGVL